MYNVKRAIVGQDGVGASCLNCEELLEKIPKPDQLMKPQEGPPSC
jgi:hypothetical protein